jgi:hypothetical protein
VPIEVSCFCLVTDGGIIGIGIDSTTTFSTFAQNSGVAAELCTSTCTYAASLTTGFHYLQRLESITGGAPTFYYTNTYNGANGLTSTVFN